MAQSEAQGERNDKQPIQNSRAGNHRPEHRDNSGSRDTGDVQRGLTNESKIQIPETNSGPAFHPSGGDGRVGDPTGNGCAGRGSVALQSDRSGLPAIVIGGEDALSATLTELGRVPGFDAGCHVATSDLPHMATDDATRGESPATVTKQTTATRGKSRPVVEPGKGSKGTWQFRLRWNSEPGRPVFYVISVADSTYELIRKGDYEAYKRSLIAEYEASAVSANNTD